MVVCVILKVSETPVAIGNVERPSCIAKVNGTDGRHFLIGQFKVEDADVFKDVVGVCRTGNRTKTFLHMPAEDNLIDRFPVCGGYLPECGIINVTSVVI